MAVELCQFLEAGLPMPSLILRAVSGEGKRGRHLKLTALDELPRDAVRAWLRTAAELTRNER